MIGHDDRIKNGSAVGIVHRIDVVVGEIHVHHQVGHLHHFWVPVSRGLEDVVHWDPGVDEDWLFDDWQLGAACATCRELGSHLEVIGALQFLATGCWLDIHRVHLVHTVDDGHHLVPFSFLAGPQPRK